MIPVVAASHPLSALEGPIEREALEPHMQLVLTDRTPLHPQNSHGGIISHHIWRFADLSTRLEFLLAGFGWCQHAGPYGDRAYRGGPVEEARAR